MEAVILLLAIAPLVLTIWNIYTFLAFLTKNKDSLCSRILEPMFITVGAAYLASYINIQDIRFAEWNKQLYNSEKHFFLSPERLPTVCILLAVVVLAYILLRYIPTAKLPPLAASFGIAGTYIGITLCIVFCIQVFPDIWMILFTFNCMLILVKTVCIVVKRRNAQLQNGEHFTRFKNLSNLMNSWVGLPALGFLALIPLLGIIFVILTLFGQQPSDVIRMWTETADWTMSQKIPPQNIAFDEHYLCTVAAGGHRKVVKPLRTGVRHGHRVVVNRQLCIANAFEEVIQQRIPRFHKIVRTVYDSTGYPIAKHIRSKYMSDIIYYIMKPLEWLFLIVLYATCTHPEDRIAVQYPHSTPPKASYAVHSSTDE